MLKHHSEAVKVLKFKRQFRIGVFVRKDGRVEKVGTDFTGAKLSRAR